MKNLKDLCMAECFLYEKFILGVLSVKKFFVTERKKPKGTPPSPRTPSSLSSGEKEKRKTWKKTETKKKKRKRTKNETPVCSYLWL